MALSILATADTWWGWSEMAPTLASTGASPRMSRAMRARTSSPVVSRSRSSRTAGAGYLRLSRGTHRALPRAARRRAERRRTLRAHPAAQEVRAHGPTRSVTATGTWSSPGSADIGLARAPLRRSGVSRYPRVTVHPGGCRARFLGVLVYVIRRFLALRLSPDSYRTGASNRGDTPEAQSRFLIFDLVP